MLTTRPDLLSMSHAQLDELYRAGEPGPIPNGPGKGVAIVKPGIGIAPVAAAVTRLLFWQGKTVDAQAGELLNRVTPFGIKAIRAKVYEGPSLFDDKPSIILDYAKISRFGFVRDEIRQVAPGMYLGFAFVRGERKITFALIFE
jgi:hypothetical protein